MNNKEIIKEICYDDLKEHFTQKYTIFQMSDRIKVLNDLGFTNEEIAQQLNLTESALYHIIPIRNINKGTRKLIDSGSINGYKVGRLMRVIGKNNPKETFLIKEVIKKGLSSNAAEKFVSKKRSIPDYEFNLTDWLILGRNKLSRIKEYEMDKKEKECAKIIILRLNNLLNGGI